MEWRGNVTNRMTVGERIHLLLLLKIAVVKISPLHYGCYACWRLLRSDETSKFVAPVSPPEADDQLVSIAGNG